MLQPTSCNTQIFTCKQLCVVSFDVTVVNLPVAQALQPCCFFNGKIYSSFHHSLVSPRVGSGTGHGRVVPFPAYGFAALFSNNEDLNSLETATRDVAATLY